MVKLYYSILILPGITERHHASFTLSWCDTPERYSCICNHTSIIFPLWTTEGTFKHLHLRPYIIPPI